ncbi:MAG: DMT family transporter [Geminicoccaceae bacterium]|nr:DMT family transporter [Geminicoccaceae bacterium]MCS7266460.1 DMT family transporter [Geminicoccaceae bacterium]MCX7630932.1 DMT family transporter [Geminicoccaceae bacterium]MDW8123944.1 DMT family transporter [Geminicoccaceae bacterium]MDW8339993.1 DMT family transporter [Geminicoccaceae bacterium]
MTAPASPGSANARAIALVLASSLFFALGDTIVKALARDFPVGEIVLFRSLFCLLLLVVLRRRGEPPVPRGLGHPLLLARSAFEIAVTAFFFAALALMPLGDAVAILFVSPVLLTALAGPLLGERVDRRHWSAVLAGFAGVLLIVRPGGGGYGVEALLPLLAASAIAGRDLLARRLPARLDNRTVVFATTLALLAFGALVAPWSWRTPTPEFLAGVAVAALTVTLAFWSYVAATRTAEVAVLQPFKYASVPLSYVLGHLVFGETPDPAAAIGVALIVFSGLAIWRSERARAGGPRAVAGS